MNLHPCTRKGVGVRVPSSAPVDLLEEIRITRRPRTFETVNQIITEFKALCPSTDRAGIMQYLSILKQRGNCNRTCANKLLWVRRHLGEACPITTKDFPRWTMKMPDIYSDAELSAFFIACNGRHLAFFKTLLFAGLRMTEVKYLEWTDIVDGIIRVKAKPRYGFEPKDHEERQIPVPKELVRLLDNMAPRPGPLVFPTASGLPDRHLLRHCKRIAVRAGLNEEDFSLHKFRRTCITKLLRSGMDLRTVMSIAGHSSIESTMRYLRPMEGRELAERVERVWSIN